MPAKIQYAKMQVIPLPVTKVIRSRSRTVFHQRDAAESCKLGGRGSAATPCGESGEV